MRPGRHPAEIVADLDQGESDTAERGRAADQGVAARLRLEPRRWRAQCDAGATLDPTLARELARREGIFCGVSSGGSIAAALRLSSEVENAVIVAIICDRGDRYLSTGVFPA